MRSGVLWCFNILHSGPPPWSFRPDHFLEHQVSTSHTAQKGKRKKKRKQDKQINNKEKKFKQTYKQKQPTEKAPRQMVKTTLIRQEHIKKHKLTLTRRRKEERIK